MYLRGRALRTVGRIFAGERSESLERDCVDDVACFDGLLLADRNELRTAAAGVVGLLVGFVGLLLRFAGSRRCRVARFGVVSLLASNTTVCICFAVISLIRRVCPGVKTTETKE